LRNHISGSFRAFTLLGCVVFFATTCGAAPAMQMSVAELDAKARTTGNRLDVAMHVGENLFATTWPAQVMQVSANALDRHVVVGLLISGVKFHRPMTRSEFVGEIMDLVGRVFSNAPSAEEVDVWTSVPIAVGKGAIVSGDMAVPTTRTVFAVSARRGETQAQLLARVRSNSEAFWDEEWSRTAFKVGN
jgi:hypothetical protein